MLLSLFASVINSREYNYSLKVEKKPSLWPGTIMNTKNTYRRSSKTDSKITTTIISDSKVDINSI